MSGKAPALCRLLGHKWYRPSFPLIGARAWCAVTRDPDWRRDLDARRGAPGPAHPIVLAVVQWLIQALNPHPIRRRLYPVQRWALLNHYQHTCGRKP